MGITNTIASSPKHEPLTEPDKNQPTAANTMKTNTKLVALLALALLALAQASAVDAQIPYLSEILAGRKLQHTTPCNTGWCVEHELETFDHELGQLRKLLYRPGRPVHNVAKAANAASKAAVVAGAVTNNPDMMKAGVAATAATGAVKVATKPNVRNTVRKAKRKVKRALKG